MLLFCLLFCPVHFSADSVISIFKYFSNINEFVYSYSSSHMWPSLPVCICCTTFCRNIFRLVCTRDIFGIRFSLVHVGDWRLDHFCYSLMMRPPPPLEDACGFLETIFISESHVYFVFIQMYNLQRLPFDIENNL